MASFGILACVHKYVTRCRPALMLPRYVGLLALVLALAWTAPALALEATPIAVKRVAMIGFTVSDMERSVAFYEKVLNFEKVDEVDVTGAPYNTLSGVFGSNVRVVHMRLGDQTLELTQYVAPPDGRPIPVPSHSDDLWFEHMAIVVSDMEKAYDVLRKNHVRQISPEPQIIPASNVPAAGIKALKFRDPDNHDLELIYFPEGKGNPRWHQPTNRLFLGLDHTAITISNTEQSLKFYRDLLGFKVGGVSLNTGITQEQLDNVFGARVLVTAVDPTAFPPHIEFLQYETPPGGRPMPLDSKANDLWHWQPTLVVDDVAAAANTLRAAGVRFVSPNVVTAPSGLGFSRAIMVLDPDGHVMRLVQQ
jgi:catechol 2,3-dioxygenase-like lactoylglutathione lyase family enzyme